MRKFLIILILTLSFSVSVYAEDIDSEVADQHAIEDTNSISISSFEVGELVEGVGFEEYTVNEASEELENQEPIVIDVSDIEDEPLNALIKPFEEYTPTDLFTFIIMLIEIFNLVIKLFIHKWGFGGF